MNFTKISHGNVDIINHSTSNTIEIRVRSMEPITQGGKLEEIVSTLWIDVESLKDLQTACLMVGDGNF